LSKFAVRTILPLVVLSLATISQARAQGLSPYVGLGTATDTAATTARCATHFVLDVVSGVCEAAASIHGPFGVFGADFMLMPHFGINGEYAFHFTQDNYLPTAGIKYRPAFFDVNAIYQPFFFGGRIAPIVEGGVGVARVSVYLNPQICPDSTTCPASGDYFQVHGAIGVKLYIEPNVFVKPQVDLHWARNLNQQFGRDLVPQYTISVGYSFGEH
jgi:hypothetical protein